MAQKKLNKKNSDLTKVIISWEDGTSTIGREEFLTKEQMEDLMDRVDYLRRQSEQMEKEKLQPSESVLIEYLEGGSLSVKSQKKLKELREEFEELTFKERIPFYGIPILISIRWDVQLEDWICRDNSSSIDSDQFYEQIARTFPEGNVINKKLLGELQLHCPSLEVNKIKQKKLVKEWYKKCTAWVKEELKKEFNPEWIDSLADIGYVIECVFDYDYI